MELKDVRLKKGMSRDEVNGLIRDFDIELLDETYEGNSYPHNWKADCGHDVEGRMWSNIRGKGRTTCIKCKLNIKDKIETIKDVYLEYGMNRSSVNERISKWLLLEDEKYKGNKHNHSWICLNCNNVFKKKWSNIKSSSQTLCEHCRKGKKETYDNIEDVILEKNMSKYNVNKLISKWIQLSDSIYLNNRYNHNWICKCGNTFARRWDNIKHSHQTTCKECAYNKIKSNHKFEIERNKEYTYVKSYFTGDTLSNGKIAKSSHVRVKHKYCGMEYDVQYSGFTTVGYRCGQCCQGYENSFAYHIEEELNESLEKYWDFNKNIINPYHVFKGTKKKVWIKCQEKNYHGSYKTTCLQFIRGTRCQYCSSRKVHRLDSFGYHHFDKVMSWHQNNKISPFRVAPKSVKKYKFICETCGETFEKSLLNISSRGDWCPKCSASKGEKRIIEILRKNNIEFEYNKEYFDDLKGLKIGILKPDFILPNQKIWIEYDGEFHFKNISGNLDSQQEHDKRKDEYSKEHRWKMIRIPYWDFDDIEDILNRELNIGKN